MAQFQMTYPYERRFFDGRVVEPGEIVTADENPDPNFFEEVAAPAAPAPTDPSTPDPFN